MRYLQARRQHLLEPALMTMVSMFTTGVTTATRY
jgi:hypothetical protein